MSLAAVGVGLATYAGGATAGAALAAGAGALVAGQVGGGTASSGATSRSKGTSEDLTIEQLQLEDEAVDKIMKDILGQADGGIADILSQENISGIFDTSVAAQASGDLVSKLTGEIAKLTGKQVTASSGKTTKKIKEESTEDSLARLLGDVRGIGDLVADIESGDLGTGSQD